MHKTVSVCDLYHPVQPVRIVTAASLFDGHDAAINIMRRLLQKGGAEIIHLGHNIEAEKVVHAALQEDVHAVALSSYQGGHMEYFTYVRELLDQNGGGHIKIFGGGGGVILPSEIEELHSRGIERIYSPEDGQKMGLDGMISDCLKRSDYAISSNLDELSLGFTLERSSRIARAITILENEMPGHEELRRGLQKNRKKILILGITGTGGSGKSSLTDELILRFLNSIPGIKIAIACVDPTRKKTGGALLGDRIRMNSLRPQNVYMRSMATRESQNALSRGIEDAILVFENADFDLIFIETSGIGQGDTEISSFSDKTLYVMTPEYGASTQLEKIGMLDCADFVVLNKVEKRGGEDAFHDVCKQVRRNHDLSFDAWVPVFATTASQFNNPGVTELFCAILENLAKDGFLSALPKSSSKNLLNTCSNILISPERANYLSEISRTIRTYHEKSEKEAEIASLLYALQKVANIFPGKVELRKEVQKYEACLSLESKELLCEYEKDQLEYRKEQFEYEVRGKKFCVDLMTNSLSGTRIPRVSLPSFTDFGDRLRFMRKENLPGKFPYTAGVFPFKRADEEPKRQFAGEGGPIRTNKRFHYLCQGEDARRLSVAFDSVTLYGEDPDRRPDIYGKIGESGVSICTFQDMKDLMAGFDLLHPNTSVSMTINGPAPILLAMFLNTAAIQQAEQKGIQLFSKEYEAILRDVITQVRGTVQADILKEDQAQNTCIFSVDFALKMMGDIQQYFIENKVRNFYSVSISGYHIAEAGANPITQAALTLANGFTFVEVYLQRGMKIDDFAPNLSFFFSNGMDPEYSVIGRVARRIWAIAIRYRYLGNDRSQKLKYHIQTSGRSLHAQEIQFNDIRTTLQALMAIYDNCNSLHTNAYDEAITTPTEESVRRAMAIQMIINRELGNTRNENPLQGSFFWSELTDLVEEAILCEFDRISRRGGVLGAMETQYQRSKIQEESMLYEMKKSTGELPIIGVNTFLPKEVEKIDSLPVTRASYEEKDDQIHRLEKFKQQNLEACERELRMLREVALKGGNIFAQLMQTVRFCSLGQITRCLYEVGGQYRRSM